MFHRRRWVNWSATALFILAVGACDGLGGGCGCAAGPLPEGGLPGDQTLEGGAQIRVTEAGFTKLTSIIPTLINDGLGDGFCIPPTDVVDIVIVDVDVCERNDGSCTPGCQVDIGVDFIDLSVPSTDGLRVDVQFDVGADVFVDAGFFGDCTLSVGLNNGRVTADIAFGIDPATGELDIGLADLQTFDITGTNISGCGLLGTILGAVVSFVANLFEGAIGDFVIDLIEPLIEDLIAGMLPDPLGIEGMVDAGELLGAVSPGTNATIEMRAVPGGFVELAGGGMSLGVIVGMNADEDLATREPDLDSEPAFCVPPVSAPDFSFLPGTPRGTFTLPAADAFIGNPDPEGADLIMGLSETALDLAGHHAFSSGALCLGLGTALVPELNLGTIGLLVPSLAELSETGRDPLLLVTRPLRPIDFTIGEGTTESPHLTVHFREFEVDLYAFVFERFVRGVTLKLGMDLGVNLEYMLDADGNPALLPTLSGLSADEVSVEVLNEEFLREGRDELEAILPSVFDLVTPLLSGGLEPIALPEFAGFALEDLGLSRVETSEDQFLAITASLGVSSLWQDLARRHPDYRTLQKLVESQVRAPVARAETRATLRGVDLPAPETVRAALLGEPGGALPEIAIDVAPTDELGRPLEWTWRLGDGMWRPFTSASPLVVSDRALAYQAEWKIDVRARVAGDYRTLDLTPETITVTVDTAGPWIRDQQARVERGALVIPAIDVVTDNDAIEFAYGLQDGEPATAWTRDPVAVADAVRLADRGELVVFARDREGNVSHKALRLDDVLGFHGSGEGGCDCRVGGETGSGAAGPLALFAVTLLALGGRRRLRRGAGALWRRVRSADARRVAMWAIYVGGAVALSSLPACSCGGAATCAIDEDCDADCPEGEIGICFFAGESDGSCLCQEDVPVGRNGQHTSMALSDNGSAWVSAYNARYGDLVVVQWPESGPIPDEAWTFADGVPEGPVILERSEIRSGILEPGEDVGLYTDIAVTPDGAPVVSYFDRENGSLKFATFRDGVWQVHTVQAGSPEVDPELGFEIVGQYSSITVRSDDGRPGIAYFVHLGDGGGAGRTQVRFAAAQTPFPARSDDWLILTVDEVPVTVGDPDPFNIPPGTGLFIDSARRSDQSPVLAYYDRSQGNLVVASFDAAQGVFLPEVLDGDDGTDVGWYPSIAIDSEDQSHITYVSATGDDLRYVNTIDRAPEVVDDGFRIVGTTPDDLPKPEFHFVGDDSSIVLTPVGPVIAYQDATTHELLMARQDGDGRWLYETIAGDEDPFVGAYGFYNAAQRLGETIVIATWVVDQPTASAWVEIFRQSIVVQ